MTRSQNDNGLPHGWVHTTLGGVCKTTSGGTPSRAKKEYFGGTIPWLKSGELNDGFVDVVEECITKKGLESSSSRIVPSGTLLIALYGATVGKLGILRRDAAINQAICAISCPDGIYRDFLFWFLRGYRGDLLNARKGGAQPNISQKIINDIPIALPPHTEQHRIVAKTEELLTRLDAGVKALQAVKAQLKRYRQSVLKCAFEGKLTTEWREAHKGKLEPASALLERIKEERKKKLGSKYKESPPVDTSELAELPHGWEWTRLDDCSVFITKGESPKWQGYNYVNDGVLFIRSENVLWGKVDCEGAARVPLKFHNKLKRSQLQPNDVLLNLVGASIGRCAVLPSTVEQANINQAVALIRVASEVEPTYLMHLLLSPHVQTHMRGVKVETARANISLIDVREFLISFCSRSEQKAVVSEIERCFSVADAIEKSVDQSLAQSERLRQSILKRAFEGKLVPQDPNDPPASELLDRIKIERESGINRPTKKMEKGTTAGR